MIRVGLIGLGMMGRCHLAAWNELDGVQVVAIADRDPKRAVGDLSGGWSNIDGGAESIDMTGITGTTDPLELIGMADVDLVDVCVPTPFHEDLAIPAMQAGKHVVCEKPLGRTAERAQKIVAAAAAATGLFMPAMCMRFWPGWTWLKDAVASGEYGKVLAATFRRMSSMPPGWYSNAEMSGGAVLDLHLHDTDFVNYLFGRPKSVSSVGYSKTTDGIDHIVTRYDYDDVPLVVAEGGWSLADGAGFSMRYSVNFENATAEFDLARDEPLTLARGGEIAAVALPPGDGYVGELSYMLQCIEAGEAPTTVTAEQAAESVAMVEAEVQSVKTGKAVTL